MTFFNYTSPLGIPRTDPYMDSYSAACLTRLRDWADGVEDSGSARFDKEVFGVGGRGSDSSPERLD